MSVTTKASRKSLVSSSGFVRCDVDRSRKEGDEDPLSIEYPKAKLTFIDGTCTVCISGAEKAWPTDYLEKINIAKDASQKGHEEIREMVITASRVLVNPRLATFILQKLNEYQQRSENHTVNFALMDEDQIAKLVRLHEKKMPPLIAVPHDVPNPLSTGVSNLFYVKWDPDFPEIPWHLYPTASMSHEAGIRLIDKLHSSEDQVIPGQGLLRFTEKREKTQQPPTYSLGILRAKVDAHNTAVEMQRKKKEDEEKEKERVRRERMGDKDSDDDTDDGDGEEGSEEEEEDIDKVLTERELQDLKRKCLAEAMAKGVTNIGSLEAEEKKAKLKARGKKQKEAGQTKKRLLRKVTLARLSINLQNFLDGTAVTNEIYNLEKLGAALTKAGCDTEGQEMTVLAANATLVRHFNEKGSINLDNLKTSAEYDKVAQEVDKLDLTFKPEVALKTHEKFVQLHKNEGNIERVVYAIRPSIEMDADQPDERTEHETIKKFKAQYATLEMTYAETGKLAKTRSKTFSDLGTMCINKGLAENGHGFEGSYLLRLLEVCEEVAPWLDHYIADTVDGCRAFVDFDVSRCAAFHKLMKRKETSCPIVTALNRVPCMRSRIHAFREYLRSESSLKPELEKKIRDLKDALSTKDFIAAKAIVQKSTAVIPSYTKVYPQETNELLGLIQDTIDGASEYIATRPGDDARTQMNNFSVLANTLKRTPGMNTKSLDTAIRDIAASYQKTVGDAKISEVEKETQRLVQSRGVEIKDLSDLNLGTLKAAAERLRGATTLPKELHVGLLGSTDLVVFSFPKHTANATAATFAVAVGTLRAIMELLEKACDDARLAEMPQGDNLLTKTGIPSRPGVVGLELLEKIKQLVHGVASGSLMSSQNMTNLDRHIKKMESLMEDKDFNINQMSRFAVEITGGLFDRAKDIRKEYIDSGVTREEKRFEAMILKTLENPRLHWKDKMAPEHNWDFVAQELTQTIAVVDKETRDSSRTEFRTAWKNLAGGKDTYNAHFETWGGTPSAALIEKFNQADQKIRVNIIESMIATAILHSAESSEMHASLLKVEPQMRKLNVTKEEILPQIMTIYGGMMANLGGSAATFAPEAPASSSAVPAALSDATGTTSEGDREAAVVAAEGGDGAMPARKRPRAASAFDAASAADEVGSLLGAKKAKAVPPPKPAQALVPAKPPKAVPKLATRGAGTRARVGPK